MATTGTEVLRSTIMGGGNTSENNTVALGGVDVNTGVSLTQEGILQSVFKNAAVTITSVADSSGFCVFTKSSHGLSVGQYLMISGATAPSLNTVHKITAKDGNTFTTNVAYTASATAGVYRTQNGNMGVVAEGKYAGWQLTDELAGISSTAFDNTGGDAADRSNHKLESARRLNITSIDYNTGVATLGANAGASYDYHKGLNETPIDQAASPTRAVPGELVIMTGSNTPSYEDYTSL